MKPSSIIVFSIAVVAMAGWIGGVSKTGEIAGPETIQQKKSPYSEGAAGRRQHRTGEMLPLASELATGGMERQMPAPLRRLVTAPDLMAGLESQERVRMVEKVAARRLEALTSQLALSPAQQEAIFPLLARTVPAWMPQMAVVRAGVPGRAAPSVRKAPSGAPSETIRPASTPVSSRSENSSKPAPDGGAAAESPSPPARLTREEMLAEISKYLTPDQRAAFLRAQLQQRLWWNDTMARIARTALGAGTPDAPESANPAPPRRGGRPQSLDSLNTD